MMTDDDDRESLIDTVQAGQILQFAVAFAGEEHDDGVESAGESLHYGLRPVVGPGEVVAFRAEDGGEILPIRRFL